MKAGTTVVFRNRDDISGTALSAAKGEFHSKALDTDDSCFEFTFAKAGTYAYSCGLHPQAAGQDRGHAVRREASEAPGPASSSNCPVALSPPIRS